MVTRRKESEPSRPRRSPATTDAERETQLIAQAYDLAERQLLDGSISATVHTHFLKAGSQRERLEQQKMAMEANLLQARIDALESQRSSEELYGKAMAAMRRYSGQDEEDA